MGLESFRKSSSPRCSRWSSMVDRKRRSFSLPSVRKSIPLVCCHASSTVLKAAEIGGWQVFDVGRDAHFVEEFQELGGGGQGEPGFAVNVGP